MGWASGPENSFLATHEETRRDLAAAGFEIVTFRDMAATAEAEAAARRKLQAEGLPPLGPHIIRPGMGCRCRSTACAPAKTGACARCRSWPESPVDRATVSARAPRHADHDWQRGLRRAVSADDPRDLLQAARRRLCRGSRWRRTSPRSWCSSATTDRGTGAWWRKWHLRSRRKHGIKVDFTLLPIDALSARLKAELNSGSNGIDIVQWTAPFAGWLAQHMEDHEKLLATAAARHPRLRLG